jgi:hypothetical protein
MKDNELNQGHIRTLPDSRRDRVRARAYQFYVQKGRVPGFELEDWLRAEEEIAAVEDRLIDEASEESFPASDPPAF